MGCPFAHSESELCEKPSLQATGLCYEYAKTGRCRKGQACNFAHGQHELRASPPAKKASVPPVSWVASMASACGPPTKHEAGLRDRDANHDGEPTSQGGGDDGEDDARIAHGFGDQPRSPHTSSTILVTRWIPVRLRDLKVS